VWGGWEGKEHRRGEGWVFDTKINMQIIDNKGNKKWILIQQSYRLKLVKRFLQWRCGKKFNLLRSRKWYAICIRLRNNVIKYEFMLGVDHAFITRGLLRSFVTSDKTETNVLFNPSLQMIAKEQKKNNKCCKTDTSRGTITDGRVALRL